MNQTDRHTFPPLTADPASDEAQTIEFAPIVLLGAAPEVALFKGVIDAVWGMYIHSNLDVRAGKLGYLFNGPEQHRVHHARNYQGVGTNFATKLAIWDRLFGTTFLPPGRKPAGYGLPHVPMPAGYWRQVFFAFRRERAVSTTDGAKAA